MIRSIEEYLALLEKELAGSDSAMIQDALADAEEHLRTALDHTHNGNSDISKGDVLSSLITEYGSPQEVAQAYREFETRIPPTLKTTTLHRVEPSGISKFFGVFADPAAWGALLYGILSLATGIVYFTWAVTGVSLSLGLMILIIGLPFTILFLYSVRGIAFVEGRIVEALLGVRMPRRQRFSDVRLGWIEKLKNLFSDKHTWLSLGYLVLQLPLGVIYFTLFITLIAVALSAVATPITQSLGVPMIQTNAGDYYIPNWGLPVVVLAGVVLLTATMHLAKVIGRAHGALAKAALVKD
jgi:hypothetical protein